MKFREARARARDELAFAGIQSPGLEGDILVSWAAGTSSSFLLAHPELPLPGGAAERLMEALQRRTGHEPLQYILGTWDFFGRSLIVRPGVLIPRADTELLVEKALERLSLVPGTFLDWGTGTGCIALSLLAELPGAEGIAADASALAVDTAWRNLKHWGVLGRCLLWHSRMPRDIPAADGSLSLLVSNPPYIPDGRIPFLMEEVRREPLSALAGGEDGLKWYRMLLEWAPAKLRPGGWVLFETGDGAQAEALAGMAPPCLELEGIFRDLGDIPRAVSWRRV